MRTKFVLIATLLLSAAAPGVVANAAESWDGLVEVNSRSMGAAFLLPGADFRPYAKVMLDEPEVAFRNNWMRDVNRSRSGRRVTEADAERILATAATNTTDIFTREFTRAGYQVVTKPGPDVLRVSTAVINLVVNAPDVASAGRSQSFTTNAGEATLVVEARDSLTNALLARAVDRRQTRGQTGQMTPTNSVTNTAEFRRLAQTWARASASKLQSLKAVSPVPDPLAAGQRIK